MRNVHNLHHVINVAALMERVSKCRLVLKPPRTVSDKPANAGRGKVLGLSTVEQATTLVFCS
jgi:hypothetical protein